jgi:hypothetical protein
MLLSAALIVAAAIAVVSADAPQPALAGVVQRCST